VIDDAVSYLPGEVESLAIVFQEVNGPQGLLIVSESLAVEFVENVFTDMAEGSMPEVMSQADCFSQVFIKVECPGDSASYLGYLQGVGESGYVVVTHGSYEYLRLMLEAAECFGVDDAVTVTLKSGANSAGLFVFQSASRQPAFLSMRREAFFFFFS